MAAFGSLTPDFPSVDPDSDQAAVEAAAQAAAQRQRRTVMPPGGRKEGRATATLDAIGEDVYKMAARPSRIMGALAEVPPGQPMSERPDIVDAVAQTAFDVVGLPGLTGAIPSNALGSAAKGIRAYHGSPYDFDKFDMARIGDGEGAQRYGHGLYFAEHPKVAESYKLDPAMMEYTHGANLEGTELDAANRFWQNGSDHGAALADVKKRIEQSRMYGDTPDSLAELKKEHDLLASGWKPPAGKTYEVNIDAKPEHFLHWDKSIGEQSPKVQDGIRRLIGPEKFDEFAKQGIGGSDVYQDVARALLQQYNDPTLAAKAFREVGIPGVKYHDQLSRGTNAAKTHNYVAFDDKLVKILRKYAVPGVVGAGGFGSLAPGSGDQQ